MDGFVVLVGGAAIDRGSATFTMVPHADPAALAPSPVSIAVRVSGSGDDRGDPAAFWSQVAPSARASGQLSSIVLVAAAPWKGLAAFASGVARETKLPVEVALPVQALAGATSGDAGWGATGLIAVALGRPDTFGFSAALLDDDLTALDALDARGVQYRCAIVIQSRVEPVPGEGVVAFHRLLMPEAADHRVQDGEDVFTLRAPLAWGSSMLPAGAKIELETVNTARYARDLGLLLRPERAGLAGWDTVGLPAQTVVAGMSREALYDFLRGGSPVPSARIDVRWSGSSRMTVAIDNPTPHETGIGSLANFVEVRYAGTEILDVQAGEFTNIEYGRIAGGRWETVSVPRSADAVRFHFRFLAPHDMVSGGGITFVSGARSVRVRYGLLVGDGSAISGPWVDRSPGR